MMQQMALDTRDALLTEATTERGLYGAVTDLNDELTVICTYAHLGGEFSYDSERTENYFSLIETAGKKAAQITGQLIVLDPPRPPDPSPVGSSFRRRLLAARAVVTG